MARGKKLVSTQYLERGDTKDEGYVDDKGVSYLQHINFPYNAGDVLLIASEGQGADKIEPVCCGNGRRIRKPYDTGCRVSA